MRVDVSFTFPRLAAVLLVAWGAAAEAAVDRNLSGAWSPAGARRVALSVAVGEIAVVPSTDGRVHASVALEARAVDFRVLRWANGYAQELVAGATLIAEPAGERLILRVAYPGRHADHVVERWQLEVPPELGVDARLNVGDLAVRDVGGGLELEVNVGDLRAEVALGPVRAHVNVGSLVLNSRAEHFGTVLLESNLGNVAADLRGRAAPTEPVTPPAARLRMQGDGEDYYFLTANVGDVNLNLRTR